MDAMRNLDEHTITQAVLERFSNTPDPRLKEIIFLDGTTKKKN
jgi:hypothetical protein